MKWRSLLAVVTAALLAGTAGLVLSAGVGDTGLLSGTAIGSWLGIRTTTSPAPAGVIPALDGQTIGPLTLTDLGGHLQPLPSPTDRRVLVNVWASWCVPCRDEMPLLAQFAKSQGADGVAVVGIAEDDAPSVRDYLRRTSVDYPILLDDAQWRAGTRLGNRLGVLPFTALIDADGHLLRHQAGPFASVEALKQWVDARN